MQRGTTILSLLLAIAVSADTSADEYFGEFKDTLVGEFETVEPRPLFRLTADFRFLDPNGLTWHTPADTKVDGASIPQPFWSAIGGPFSGKYINASVIHDYYCDTKQRTEHDTHRNFYYGMRASGVGNWKARFMYWAVATFGPKWKLERRVRYETTCVKSGDGLDCTDSPVFVMEPVTVPTVDLGDPEVFATALSKASAVARALKTSNGAILDVTPTGVVAAELDNIAASATSYRQVFAEKEYRQDPSRLGVLSSWPSGGLDAVAVWEGGVIPSYNETPALNYAMLEQMKGGQEFRLDAGSLDLVELQIDIESLRPQSERMQ